MAKLDLIIRGGRVIGPARGVDGVRELAVKKGTIVQVHRSRPPLLEEQVPEAA